MDCEISAELTNANQTLPLAKLGGTSSGLLLNPGSLPTHSARWARLCFGVAKG